MPNQDTCDILLWRQNPILTLYSPPLALQSSPLASAPTPSGWGEFPYCLYLPSHLAFLFSSFAIPPLLHPLPDFHSFSSFVPLSFSSPYQYDEFQNSGRLLSTLQGPWRPSSLYSPHNCSLQQQQAEERLYCSALDLSTGNANFRPSPHLPA